MDGNQRRKNLLKQLTEADKPISANCFARMFNVSRQIIVGDVALLRASGLAILATSRGYILSEKLNKKGIFRKIACQHGVEETEEELHTIVTNGGEIVDVIVEHPLYGELTGNLHISTQKDIDRFMKKYQKSNATLLSILTGGIHLHTIHCENIETFELIKQALVQKNFLYQE